MRSMKTAILTSAALIGLAIIGTAPATADQVILDDLIVDGSACIGFDCVNGESFGFDTIRIKENNLRIKAQDTSSTASFPSNDWQITFNDSANGGANKFSIDDIDGGRTPFTIEAGAPSHSLYVDDGGRLGLGTNTPVTDIHIKSGNTPTLRLEQDGSSGFTPQTWDVAGNEANFFIRDATNGSTLPIRLRPGAPSSAIDIAASGNVGMGTSSPASNLHVNSSASSFVQIDSDGASLVGVFMDNTAGGYLFQVNATGDFQVTEDGSGGAEFSIDSDAAGATPKFLFADGNVNQLMEILANGNVNSLTGTFGMISDRNVKTDVSGVDAAKVLAKVAEMPISTWRYKHTTDELHMGPMAQDFYGAFGLYQGPTSIALNDLSGVALAAIQGLNQELEAKDAVIEELLARVGALEVAQQ